MQRFGLYVGDEMKFICSKKQYSERYRDYTFTKTIVNGFTAATRWKNQAVSQDNVSELSICDESGDLVFFKRQREEEEYYDCDGNLVSSFYWAVKDLCGTEDNAYVYRAFRRRDDGVLEESQKVYNKWGHLRNRLRRDSHREDLEVADVFMIQGEEGVRVYYFEKGRTIEFWRADGTRTDTMEEMGR